MAKLSDNRAEIEADVLLEMKKQETLESDINQEMQIAEEKIIQLKNERQRGPGNEISNGIIGFQNWEQKLEELGLEIEKLGEKEISLRKEKEILELRKEEREDEENEENRAEYDETGRDLVIRKAKAKIGK